MLVPDRDAIGMVGKRVTTRRCVNTRQCVWRKTTACGKGIRFVHHCFTPSTRWLRKVTPGNRQYPCRSNVWSCYVGRVSTYVALVLTLTTNYFSSVRHHWRALPCACTVHASRDKYMCMLSEECYVCSCSVETCWPNDAYDKPPQGVTAASWQQVTITWDWLGLKFGVFLDSLRNFSSPVQDLDKIFASQYVQSGAFGAEAQGIENSVKGVGWVSRQCR